MAELDLELLASIASGGLGSWVQDGQGQSVYVKNDDCIGCLRDLQRFFRYDDPEQRPAFFAVSKYNFARSDLVPLIVTHPDDYDVVYNALKVATFLTMPSSHTLVTTNKAKQEEHMQAVREAFLAQDALAAVVGMLAEPLSKHPRMDERDAALVQLVIAFLKNLVSIPEAPAATSGGGGNRKDTSRRIQTGLIGRLFSDNVMDLLLLLAQHSQQRPFKTEAPVLAEIFMHLFSGVEPQQLLDSHKLLEQQQQQQRREDAQRQATLHKQQQQRRGGGAAAGGARAPVAANTSHLPRLPAAQIQQPMVYKGLVPRHMALMAPSRHAHSGAVYVRRHSEHSSNIVVRHNPNRSELPRLPAVADAKKAAAQRKDGAAAAQAGGGGGGKPRLGAELLVRLDQYLQQFLEGGYELLMGQVFKELEPGLNISRLNEADFLNFVHLSTYCTRYVRLREERKLQDSMQRQRAGQAAAGADKAPGAGSGDADEASPFSAISATMGWDCFHWVTMLWILLSNMEGGGKQKDHSDKNWELQHASVPLLKEMLLTLDLARVAGNTADRRAADRLQRRLLHDDLKESGLLPVLSRLIKGYNFRFQPRSHAVDLVETLHVVLGMLDRLASSEPGGFKVKAAAHRGGGGRRRKPATPADKQQQEGQEDGGGGADQQQQGAGGEAAAGDEGGDAGAEAGAENQVDQQQQQGSPAGGSSNEGGGREALQEGGGDVDADADAELAQRQADVGRSGDPFSEEEHEEVDRRPATREVSFQASTRIRAECAQPIILHFYAWLLQGYRTNAPFTNHAILAFMRRVAEPGQLNLEPMLYQLSVLRLFEAILSDLAIRRNPDFQDLLTFAKHTVRNMFARMVPDLSELQQKAGAVEANLEGRFATAAAVGGAVGAGGAAGGDGDGGGSGGEQEADSAEQQARRERRKALAEIKARENAGRAMFAELLFWKGANVADDVRNEYNWRGLVDPQEHVRRGGRRGRGAALGDDDGSDGGGEPQLGFASYRNKKDGFSEEQAAQLRSEFERCNGYRDCLDRLVFEFGGQWKKAHISRQLKAMLLTKGKFTPAQDDRLKDLHHALPAALRGRPEGFEQVAEELAAGFTANQVKTQLRKLGVVASRAGKYTLEQEKRMAELYEELRGNLDCFEQIAEQLEAGVTANQVKRQLRKMGVIAGKMSRRQGRREAAFDALAAGSDEESGGEAAGGRQSDGGSAGSSGGGGSSSDSESDGGNSGFGSAKSDLEASDGGGGDSDLGSGGGQQQQQQDGEAGGASRAQHKAQRRQAALEALQRNKRQKHRSVSPELAGGVALGPGEMPAYDSDDGDDGDGISFQQTAAAAAAAAAAGGTASPASSSGGRSFVSLLDSDGEGVAAVAEADSGRRAPTAKQQQQGKPQKQQHQQPQASHQQQQAKRLLKAKAESAAAVAARRGGGSDSGSGGDSGFESALESDPGSDAELAPVKQQQAKQQQAAVKKSKKQQRGAEEEHAPTAQQQAKKQRRGKQQQEEAAAEQQQQKGDGTPGGKRKAQAPAGPSSTQKRAALEALRSRRRQQHPGGAEDQTAAAAVAALPLPATEPFGEWPEDGEAAVVADENARPQVGQPVAGRRLLKKGGGGSVATAAPAAAAAAAAAGFEELEDSD